nr:hypothetical protein RCYEFQYI_RCYEFQYI_CDS_0007 [Microvirus sp.]
MYSVTSTVNKLERLLSGKLDPIVQNRAWIITSVCL